MENIAQKIIKENLEYVKKHIGTSDGIMNNAEMWAENINNSGANTRYNFSKDTTDFKRTSYMLEMLAYILIAESSGEKTFTFPTTNKIININRNNIEKGIGTFFYPSHNLQKFAMLINMGGYGGKDSKSASPFAPLTADELEKNDMLRNKMEDFALNELGSTIEKYISTRYPDERSSLFNYLQTAFRYIVQNERRKKKPTISLDKPISSEKGSKTISDFISSDVNDELSGYSEEEPYQIDATEEDQILKILKLNNDIKELVKNESSALNKDVFEQFFIYKIIGVGGNEKTFGKTLKNKELLQKLLNKELPQELSSNLEKKLINIAIRFFKEIKPELYKKFTDENPQSFDENGNLKYSNELVLFLLKHAKGTNGSPMLAFKFIRKDLLNFMDRTITPGRKAKLDELVKNAGLINPSTNDYFGGIEYFNKLFSKTKSKVGDVETKSNVATMPAEELSENDILTEDDGGDDDFALSFGDIFAIAKATASQRKKSLQEIRLQVKNILLQNFYSKM